MNDARAALWDADYYFSVLQTLTAPAGFKHALLVSDRDHFQPVTGQIGLTRSLDVELEPLDATAP